MQPYGILPDVIRSSDVCINPFQLNGTTANILPTKLFQYMACRKPTVATRLPGTLEFLAGEQHGMVYTDLQTFNVELVRLLSSESLREELGSKAQQAVQQYDWRSIADQMANWLAEAAA